MNKNSIWSNERKEIATWLSGYLAMVKKWVDKILDNEDHEVDKNKIIKLIDEWIGWLEETKTKIMMRGSRYFITLCASFVHIFLNKPQR